MQMTAMFREQSREASACNATVLFAFVSPLSSASKFANIKCGKCADATPEIVRVHRLLLLILITCEQRGKFRNN